MKRRRTSSPVTMPLWWRCPRRDETRQELALRQLDASQGTVQIADFWGAVPEHPEESVTTAPIWFGTGPLDTSYWRRGREWVPVVQKVN